MVLAVLGFAACTTLGGPVVNENYGARPSRQEQRRRSNDVMDHIVRADDPCAEVAPVRRPAIESAIFENDRPVPEPLGPSIDRTECTIWKPAVIIRVRVSEAVDANRVVVRGTRAFLSHFLVEREVASVAADGALYEHGILGDREAGEYCGGKLVIHGALSDRIAARVESGAVVTTELISRRFGRTAACDDRQAALGTFALLMLEEADGAVLEQEKKERKNREERDERARWRLRH